MLTTFTYQETPLHCFKLDMAIGINEEDNNGLIDRISIRPE